MGMHDFVNKHISLQQRWKRYKRQVYQPPQVDEKLVSAFLNSPEAVKMVLSYLDKQKQKKGRQKDLNDHHLGHDLQNEGLLPHLCLFSLAETNPCRSFSTNIAKLCRKFKKRGGRKTKKSR